MSEDQANDIATMSFEDALARLEQIVSQLERGDVALEKSIEIYEQGEALRARCDVLLQKAEAKIEKIRLARDGSPQGTEPLDQ